MSFRGHHRFYNPSAFLKTIFSVSDPLFSDKRSWFSGRTFRRPWYCCVTCVMCRVTIIGRPFLEAKQIVKTEAYTAEINGKIWFDK